jgi:hypothetical protein
MSFVNRRFGFALGSAVFLVFSILYFLFNLKYLSRFFDWDSSVYALNIARDRWHSVFFNPHHLGFESSGYLYWKWIRVALDTTDIMFFLRVRILFFASVFLGIFGWIIYRMYGSILQSLFLTFAVGSSQAFWFYSHHNDTPLIHSCLVVILYLFLVYLAKTGGNFFKIFSFGIFHLLTLLFHQSNAILFPLTLLGLCLMPTWNGKQLDWGRKLRLSFYYNIFVGVLIVGIYFFVGFFILGRDLESIGEKNFSYWLFLYASQERWGMATGDKNYILYFYRGIGDAFLNFQGVNSRFRTDFSSPWTLKNSAYNLNLLFWISILGLGLLNFRRLLQKFSIEMLLMFFWLVPSILFYTWWEGYFFEFWVGVSIGFWIFCFFVLRSLEVGFLSNTMRSLGTVLLIIMGCFLFSYNFVYSTLPRSEKIQYGYLEGFKDKVERIANERIYK